MIVTVSYKYDTVTVWQPQVRTHGDINFFILTFHYNKK